MKSEPVKITKRVEYAYPTSTNANRFKFKSDCWCVELVEFTPTMQPPNAIAGFGTLEQAKAHAQTLPQPWDRFTK